jgi:NADP-dependent 3-hydroxy acid dehydrogenase YdfG
MVLAAGPVAVFAGRVSDASPLPVNPDAKTLVIFGAGQSLGRALSKRFGREGFNLALVARDVPRLEHAAAKLNGFGHPTRTYLADFRDVDATLRAVDAILDDFGRIDAIEYSPGGTNSGIVPAPAAALDLDALEAGLEIMLRTPLAVAHRVLPAMLERGDGAIMVTQGASARQPIPGRAANLSVPMAALRNYLHTLHGEVKDRGVYVATMSISALIAGSELAEHLTRGDAPASESSRPMVEPADLADLWWEASWAREQAEVVATAPAAASAA